MEGAGKAVEEVHGAECRGGEDAVDVDCRMSCKSSSSLSLELTGSFEKLER